MSVFLLPLEVSNDIERTLARYWWGSSQDNDNKLHWMCWDRLSKHKDAGGLGFQNFRDFNIAMLGKQAWRFLTMPESLATKVYKARYFADGNFLESSLGTDPRFIWRSIWESKDLVKSGVRWLVGPGESISIKGQPWLADDTNPCVMSESEAIVDKKVASLMCIDRRAWDVDVISDIFDERDRLCILNTRIEAGSSEDHIYWRMESSGVYSVRSAYKLLQFQKNRWNIQDSASLWKKVWKIKAPPKALNLIWRALSYCLPTNVQLKQKHVQVQATCPVCLREEESIVHVLVQCNFAAQCWRVILPNSQVGEVSCFSDWLVRVFATSNLQKRAEVAIVCWAIWKARNELVWSKKRTYAGRVVESAKEYLT